MRARVKTCFENLREDVDVSHSETLRMLNKKLTRFPQSLSFETKGSASRVICGQTTNRMLPMFTINLTSITPVTSIERTWSPSTICCPQHGFLGKDLPCFVEVLISGINSFRWLILTMKLIYAINVSNLFELS